MNEDKINRLLKKKMVNEGINTKIHKFYDRKNEIKLCVRDSFFFFASASSRQPAAN